jgi:hypothetical protein
MALALAGCDRFWPKNAVSTATMSRTVDGSTTTVGFAKRGGSDAATHVSCKASATGKCHIGLWQGKIGKAEKNRFDLVFSLPLGETRSLPEELGAFTTCMSPINTPNPNTCERHEFSLGVTTDRSS